MAYKFIDIIIEIILVFDGNKELIHGVGFIYGIGITLVIMKFIYIGMSIVVMVEITFRVMYKIDMVGMI
jgi:hypothetical protein